MSNAGPMGSYNYSHMAAAATLAACPGKGILRLITVNKKAASSVVTVYDNTAGSGTVVAIIDAATAPGTFHYDVALNTGLTIVMSGGDSDITVAWTKL